MYRSSKKPKRFDFPTGKSVAGKYVVERPLGSGWEGEVYVVMERLTGIRRDLWKGKDLPFPVALVRGKDVTPFVLDHLHRASGGATLEVNVRLVLRNAELAGQIAAALRA